MTSPKTTTQSPILLLLLLLQPHSPHNLSHSLNLNLSLSLKNSYQDQDCLSHTIRPAL
jgi:hypothetical protein